MPPRNKGRKAAKRPRSEPSIDVDKMCDYEKKRMNVCLSNNELMRKLGLPVHNNPFGNTRISPEEQGIGDSGSKSNGEDEPNNDDHPSNDNLALEKDDGLQEMDTAISSNSADKNKKVTKRGGQKTKPHNQAGRRTRSNAKKVTKTEISNQYTEEADADKQNDRQDGPTKNGIDLADDIFDEDDRIRGPNIGKKLDQMTRSRKGRLPLVIEPGKSRSSSVTIAAKFATECNITVRGHMPIFPHWKEYKKKSLRPIIWGYIERVCSKFETDKYSIHVQKACVAMLKRAVRQQRYKLKKKYFDAFPLHLVPKKSPVSSMSDGQWDTLVECWKNENKMLTCEINKNNRTKVQFHQTTGSRSYEMQLIHLANKYQNEPPDALDIFKELHYSKKKGFTPTVQSAIVEIEDKINAPVNEGEEPKDVANAVSEVLGQKTTKNRFLVNVGMKSSCAREDNAESQCELEAELVREKQANNDLREIVKTQQLQIDEMMKKFQEVEAARATHDEEVKKKQAETDALIKGFISMLPGCLPTR